VIVSEKSMSSKIDTLTLDDAIIYPDSDVVFCPYVPSSFYRCIKHRSML
jgi:hypothetical protein